ncbi:MAG: MerR family transcriptional regulator [Acidimicrobiia bacterium]|nr:MerR family transcriptional regulator [Acidimicrobiia bacterium]MDH5295044.1 MerR family transcriptional regulator [Acidimicrobiia bacterium]
MDDLVPIGRFSQMTRLSVKALRLYDELGLLEPTWVDPSSNYRYYRLGQANRAEAIRVLRHVDMPLDEIAQVLAEDDPAAVGDKLKAHRDRLAGRLADQERMLRFIEKLIEREGGIMPYEVTVKQVTEQPVLATRKHTSVKTIGDDLQAAFGALVAAMGSTGAEMAGAPFVIYHDVIDEDTDGDIEVCTPVASAAELEGDVYAATIPGGSVAFTVHRGPYQEIAPAYHTVTGWIQDHGHQFAGPPREIYLNDPTLVAPEDILTEIQWPID